jgi:hypothetical protein
MAKKATLKTSFTVDRALWSRVRIRAFQEGVQVQELIGRALEDYLRKRKGGKS